MTARPPDAPTLDHYFTRTVEHIHRVQRNTLRLVTHHRDKLQLTDEECRELMHRAMLHDRSKFSPEQFVGYVALTEYYRQRRGGNPEYDYPPGMREVSDAAVVNHYAVENHHPERLVMEGLGQWNRLQAIECACDLQAMAQEFDEGSCRKFWVEKWLPKYNKSNAFYDDYNYRNVHGWMDAAIACFEEDL